MGVIPDSGAYFERLLAEMAPGIDFYHAILAGKNVRSMVISGKKVLGRALNLKADERFMLIEGLLMSLDQPDSTLDVIWAEEADKRLKAYRAGDLEGIPMEDIFEKNQ